MASAGTVRGTALAPGVSRNGRWYRPEVIAAAVQRAQERIAEGTRPITMWTHHGAEDDTTRVVGKLTSLTVDDGGEARFTAQLADTPEGRQIAGLVDEDDPYITGVSIRGWWLDDPRMEVAPTGELAETSDDLEIDGLDFTTRPGVPLARVGEQGAPAARLITESVTEVLVEANRKPYGDVQYADPGYQADKVKRYPLDTKAHAKAAWSYINQKDNAALYTAAQLKRIRGRIKAALSRFGVDVSAETATTQPGPVLEFAEQPTVSEVTECYYGGDTTGTAGFSVTLNNGPLSINVSAYRGVLPEELPAIGLAAMKAAIGAVNVMDPDGDGDVDGDGGEGGPDDDQMESTTEPAGAVLESQSGQPAQPSETAPAASAGQQQEGETVTDPQTQAREAEDRIVARILEALRPADPPATEPTSTGPAEPTPAPTVVAEATGSE